MNSGGDLVIGVGVFFLACFVVVMLVLAGLRKFLAPRARLVAIRIGLGLTLAAVGWTVFDVTRIEHRADERRSLLASASLQGPEFRLETGVKGEWQLQRQPVERSIATSRLYVDRPYERVDETPTRVLVRVDPADAARGSGPASEGPDGSWIAPHRIDGGTWIEVDVHKSPRISWSVESVAPRLAGSTARIGFDGHTADDHVDEHWNTLAGFVLGTPLVATALALAWLLWRDRRSGASR